MSSEAALHRKLETKWNRKENELKKPVDELVKLGYSEKDIHELFDGCVTYCVANDIDLLVAINLYISIIKNPKK